MRRKGKEIKDKNAIESIIKRATVCRIALSENNVPYIVPLSFGYKDNCLYFHSAKEGKKIDIIKKNNNLCFEFDIENELVKAEDACNWDMKYYSVIGCGKAFLVEDFEEKREALDIIMEHYSGKSSFEYPEKTVSNVAIIKVKIESMSGKKSGY
ncbi:MAG: pyridoxamine 5'-phosphate oxidase family protein [Candidatus Aerophobetes bacterium]|nr:pyridoxamine 5'-phosphate oxidase family protein [Candidatus Aerophobetes bacterium]